MSEKPPHFKLIHYAILSLLERFGALETQAILDAFPDDSKFVKERALRELRKWNMIDTPVKVKPFRAGGGRFVARKNYLQPRGRRWLDKKPERHSKEEQYDTNKS